MSEADAVIRRLSALEAKVDALTAHVGTLAAGCAIPRPPPLALASDGSPARSPARSPAQNGGVALSPSAQLAQAASRLGAARVSLAQAATLAALCTVCTAAALALLLAPPSPLAGVTRPSSTLGAAATSPASTVVSDAGLSAPVKRRLRSMRSQPATGDIFASPSLE